MLVPFFQRRKEVVQAEQVTPETAQNIADWVGGQVIPTEDALDSNKKSVGINIPTLSGIVRASEGDYVVKGEHGEISKCPRVDFEHLYDRIDI